MGHEAFLTVIMIVCRVGSPCITVEADKFLLNALPPHHYEESICRETGRRNSFRLLRSLKKSDPLSKYAIGFECVRRVYT